MSGIIRKPVQRLTQNSKGVFILFFPQNYRELKFCENLAKLNCFVHISRNFAQFLLILRQNMLKLLDLEQMVSLFKTGGSIAELFHPNFG